jgi:hypothetical protein
LNPSKPDPGAQVEQPGQKLRIDLAEQQLCKRRRRTKQDGRSKG